MVPSLVRMLFDSVVATQVGDKLDSGSNTEHLHVCACMGTHMCVCVCVRACVRARVWCVRACVRACVCGRVQPMLGFGKVHLHFPLTGGIGP